MYYKKSVSEDVSGKISNSNHNKSGDRIFFNPKALKELKYEVDHHLNLSLSDSPVS